MSSFNDKTIAVSRVYADAMLSLAEPRGEAENLLGELEEVASYYDREPDFRGFLSSPLVDAEKRGESLESLFRGKGSDLLVDSLLVLNRKQRIGLVPAIAEVYREALNRMRKKVEVRVTSAIPLNDDQRAGVRAAVEQKMGLEASLVEKVDPSLIGGLVVRIGDRKADSSVATRLNGLSQVLLARASQEILSGDHVEN